MRCVLAAILGILTGCYGDPDYGGTQFKCDATHGCPDGQTCIEGRCSGGGSGADAAVSSMGVACGATVCTSTEKCCVDIIVAPRCVPLGTTCAGFEATCDGIEDCNGDPCCNNGGMSIACGITCQNQICREPADCTNPGAMMCCDIPGTDEPWGRCFSACP